jgi:predicted dehydrogenase
MRFVIGDEIEEVSAFHSSWARSFGIEDTGAVMARMSKGAHAICELSYATQRCDIVYEIYGTKGSLVVYNDDHWKIRAYIDGKQIDEDSGFEDLYMAQIDHFAMCVEGVEDPIVTGEDGLINVRVLRAAYESPEKGKHIRL